MKPSELYALEPKETWTDISVLVGCYYNHVPELGDFWQYLRLENNKRVLLKVYGHIVHDTRRFWLLAGVFFDEKPVMIIQNAGREGDDHHRRFVTHPETYFEMVKYLATIADPTPNEFLGGDIVTLDQDIPKLEEFYGESLRWIHGR